MRVVDGVYWVLYYHNASISFNGLVRHSTAASIHTANRTTFLGMGLRPCISVPYMA